MESKVNYTVIGLFVVLLTTALVIIVIVLSAKHRKVYEHYLVYMNEAVIGLSVQAPVKFSGVDVGYVSKISLNPKNPQQVRLVLKIEKGTPINQSTMATLMAQGITGVTYIGLSAGAPTAPALVRRDGEQYPIIQSRPSVLVEISTALQKATEDLQIISTAFNRLFNDKNQAALSNILKNLSAASEQFPAFISTFNQAGQKLGQATGQVSTAIKGVSQQTIPNMNQVMIRLQEIMNNMEQITNEMKNNPSVLIRGKQPAPLGPGEQ